MVDGTCDPLTEPITQDLRPLIHQNGIGADRFFFFDFIFEYFNKYNAHKSNYKKYFYNRKTTTTAKNV